MTGCVGGAKKPDAIHDGDTFTILTKEKKQVKVRFHGIDCPELGQDYGRKAKDFVSAMSFGKTVSIKENGYDRYGRLIGIIYLPDKTILNELLLVNGLAWHYKKYDSNPKWAKLEKKARKAKVGLWSMSTAIPPWDYRHPKKRIIDETGGKIP